MYGHSIREWDSSAVGVVERYVGQLRSPSSSSKKAVPVAQRGHVQPSGAETQSKFSAP
ncbi:MAG: hypothetical protein U5Q44_00085 [Dehalococcoidia bacterium]|nr:hypothetical protein [Dehalococcoidia bacterium]